MWDREKLGGGGKVVKSTQDISIWSSWRDSWVVILKSVCDWGTSGRNEKQPSVTLSIEGTGKWMQKTLTLPHFGHWQVNGGGWGWHLTSKLKWRLSGLPIIYFSRQDLLSMILLWTDTGTDSGGVETVSNQNLQLMLETGTLLCGRMEVRQNRGCLQ